MQLGNRIFYNQDGEILFEQGEMQGDVLPRKEITAVYHVDIEYGAIDYTKYKIVGIDPLTSQPILEEYGNEGE